MDVKLKKSYDFNTNGHDVQNFGVGFLHPDFAIRAGGRSGHEEFQSGGGCAEATHVCGSINPAFPVRSKGFGVW